MNFINKNKIMSFGKYFITAILFVVYSCSDNETQTVTTLKKLVFVDNFEVDGALDSAKWAYDTGTGDNGWGNNELQYYSDRLENVEVKDGMLHITALQESYMGSGYTSGKVLTRGLFETKYGRFEARIKLPWGQGLWPAFWLLGDDAEGTVIWPKIGEIDIMEYVGQEPTIAHGSIHGPGYSAGEAVTKSYTLENSRFDTDFHVFGIEWGPNYINYYIDDVLYNQITPKDLPEGTKWVFNDNQFYLILNMAVGGSFVGSPNAETEFPQKMVVDYVKVYQ
ncbi:Glycosyl hydrolases family 16 [Polaribacter sp. Hel1_33_78]|jgi:beta-glucanase (GH16 family)|uniref:glycoside hydrolase family 16 protein n=1 Tax=Polaribacter sp. Hel1_33_78 TaxID=1336804 RepID=UPI00087ABB45|nr:glycoside hydrolase family 16 protein [Polaribacter sp. Hel1_33_78]SDU10883.1 Glycosyl hydrolases family 16 [Polaribacter sp. Hel1_33_78]